MQFDIISQNLLIYLSLIYGILSFYLLTSLYKQKNPGLKKLNKHTKAIYVKNNRLTFGYLILFTLFLALALDYIFGNYAGSELPRSFIIMCLPTTLMIGTFIIATYIKKKHIYLSAAAVVFGLIFTLVIVNDYYQYDPTLASVFDKNDAQTFKANLNSVTVKSTGTVSQAVLNHRSIEYSLDRKLGTSTAGKIYSINIPGKVSKFNARSGYVYVPAIYNSSAQVNLPVIVLMPGVPGRTGDWLSLDLQNVMDTFAKAHHGITPLVFVVDEDGSIANDTECVNSSRGNAETYLSVDVPNYIKSHFRVDDSASNWSIGGLSLGGMCGIMTTLRHPNVYHYFIDLGGEAGPEIGSQQDTIDVLFGGSYNAWQDHQPSFLLGTKKYTGIGGYFGDGKQDGPDVTGAISNLSSLSKKAGLDTVSETINGGHTFDVWGQTFKDGLPWISNRVGATQCSGSCF